MLIVVPWPSIVSAGCVINDVAGVMIFTDAIIHVLPRSHIAILRKP